jgi:hypothetical protein
MFAIADTVRAHQRQCAAQMSVGMTRSVRRVQPLDSAHHAAFEHGLDADSKCRRRCSAESAARDRPGNTRRLMVFSRSACRADLAAVAYCVRRNIDSSWKTPPL